MFVGFHLDPARYIYRHFSVDRKEIRELRSILEIFVDFMPAHE